MKAKIEVNDSMDEGWSKFFEIFSKLKQEKVEMKLEKDKAKEERDNNEG